MSYYRRVGKRIFDLVLAIPAFLFFFPILVLVGFFIRFTSRGPVLFLQERLGKDGKVFILYKFRTMIDRPRTVHREVSFDNPELTFLGSWLRRSKLDELPQLWNVILGDCSIVGPRPALVTQLNDYDDQSRRRLLVRPGLTGLAQVSGGTLLTWPERWIYDVQYVDQYSFLLDLKIILRTFRVLLQGESLSLRGRKSLS